MFIQLPPELILSILSLLDLSCIQAFSLVCKICKRLVDENESSIYHALSAYRGYIDSKTAFNQLSSLYSSKSLVGVTNWKSFCQRRVHISKSWTGKASSHYVSYAGSGSKVHRIKIDEQAGFIVTSFRDGGLLVNDLTDDQVLWSLPKTYVKQFAHLEYGEGFLIFDRLGGNKEVWHLASEFPPTPPQSNTLPDQISASEESYQKHAATYPKGHFKPWAILRMPRLTSAFRFVYPTLLVGGWDHAFLWDIPSCELVQTITSIQEAEDPNSAFAVVVANAPSFDAPAPRLGPLGNLNYVDVDEKHIFICGVTALRVFSRATGKCVLDVSSARREFGSRKFSVIYESETLTEGAALVNHFTDGEEFSLSSSSFQPRIIDEFVAVHVSSCGRHLVAMLASARVVVIENFQEGPFSLYNRMVQIQLGASRSPSKYLAIHDDRVVVANNNGLFLFSLSAALEAKVKPDASPSGTMVISRAPFFGYHVYMSNVTCLQLSDIGLYLNWDPSHLQLCLEDEAEQARLDALFRVSVNDRTSRHARMPTGDILIMLDEDDFLTEKSTVCGIDFTPF
ncbi:hypothetical protein C8R41DRAFT_981845 [Lentinula lateritia]|uniref:F-box domain-containing protein n=1 Tax=Lentinula lateritia TaxID=40482 RepID=A0ABQ8VDK8_9AGAR|nr:hypothetical protein C8R41DRAFT_981845 [Lentinula lateritia]